MPAPLDAACLRWRCDEAQFDFDSTQNLPELCEVFGQDRALEAIQFGVEVKHAGYNIYALGPPGVGKRTVVRQYLNQKAAAASPPNDWCYVQNFQNPRLPHAISLPAGRGARFRAHVKAVIDDLSTSITSALTSDEHKSRVAVVMREAIEKQERALNEFAQKALAQNIQLIRTPSGFVLAPVKDGETLGPEAFQKLPAEEKAHIEQSVSGLQDELGMILEGIPELQKATRKRVRELNREAAGMAIGHLLNQIEEQYTDLPRVVQYFQDMERDVLERVDEFQIAEEPEMLAMGGSADKPVFDDYEINLLVDNSDTRGAPIVFEDHPTYQNLIGRVEHQAEMGTLTTDHTLIKAGALHRANGGYLIIEARALLQQSFAWEALERALKAHAIKIESLAEALSLLSTVSLDPEPIPLDVKVVIVGDRQLYYLLQVYDPDFPELFKVAADFDEHVERTPEAVQHFACFLGALARHEKTRPLDRSGVARMMEHAARVAEDSQRLSVHARTLADVLREADYWADKEDSPEIRGSHVTKSLERQIHRADRVRQRLQEEIQRGTFLIDTAGERVGQVNRLVVVDLGNFRFGHPSRITATARLGRGEVVDIEREVKLGGALHSKGVLILSSYLAARYARNHPLSLRASLVFEQSYGMVDGDSASVAELCALLSVLADLPIRQSLAVTGSVNQLGQVQPIGGVNEKIEGFFDISQRRGLTGEQGVLIPRTNVPHLMLREDIVAAAAAGTFHVYAIDSIDQAMELLTGVVAGQRDGEGEFPAASVNQRVESRLRELAQFRMKFSSESPSPEIPE